MKKVININFQGIVVPIEETAYDILQQYIDSLKNYFTNEEGKDEIINDIESRISELFQQRLKNGATCITDDDVNAIIENMGRPKDFADADAGDDESGPKKDSSAHSSSTHNWQFNSGQLYRDENDKILGGVCSGIAHYVKVDPWLVRILFILSGVGFLAYLILWIFLPSNRFLKTGGGKRLYRNPEDKIIAGVCGGIGSYFNVNPWIPRIIFLLPFVTFLFRWDYLGVWTFPHLLRFTFSPGTLLVYIILWAVIPEAKTTSEKLQMKGEKVDMNSIKESVSKEMKEVAERMEKFGKSASNYVKEKGPQSRKEFSQVVNRSGGVIGEIIITFFKILVYIILGAIAFAIIVTVFALAVAAIGVFPLKNFIVTDGWQNVLAWLTLIFFIGVPVVGIIAFIIRLITRRRSNSNYYRNIGIALWIFGWICLFALISFVGRDFKYISTVKEQTIALASPQVDFLKVMPVHRPDFRWRPWLEIEPFSTFGVVDDTARVPNIRLSIFKSSDSNFSVKYYTISNGNSREQADKLASQINYSGNQQDSTLYLDNDISINKHDKFRNQFVEVSVFVPVNKRIEVDRNFVSWNHSQIYFFGRPGRYYSFPSDQNNDYEYDRGTQYIMKDDGLHEVNEVDDNSSKSDGKYEYINPSRIDSLKNKQESEIQKMQKSVDSAKAAHDRELKQLQDSLIKQRNEIDQRIKVIEKKTVMIEIPNPVKQIFPVPFISYI